MQKLSLTNKYHTYPKYKDSGVGWVGDVPEKWDATRAKNVFRRNSRPVRDEDEIVTAFRDGTVTLRKNRREDGFTFAEQEIGYQGVRKGDLVIHGMDAFAGAIGVSDSDGKSSPVYAVCTPRTEADTKFHMYLLRHMSKTGYLTAIARGIRERSTEFKWNQYGNMLVVNPPKEEQEKIARFLDEQTARIDETIVKKERLIELLKEKCTATINHAVTKSLDPKAELVDSGVKEIGLMPKHWEVKKLKHQLRFLDGRRIPLSTEERTKMQGEYPYYGASGIIDHVNEYIFDEDLILISEDGANLINRSTPISFIARGKYWVNNHAHIAKPKDGNLEFWSERVEQVDVSIYTTGSAQPKLTIQALANISVSAPSDSNERMQIGAFVTQTREKYQKPLIDVGRSIQLLQEFKSSLISHTVTGKIKV